MENGAAPKKPRRHCVAKATSSEQKRPTRSRTLSIVTAAIRPWRLAARLRRLWPVETSSPFRLLTHVPPLEGVAHRTRE